MSANFFSGFESNTFNDFTTNGGSPTIVTTHPHSGTYEMKISSLASTVAQYVSYTFASSNHNGPLYFRGYVYFETLPTADNVIWKLNDSGGSTQIYITIGAGGGLIRLKDAAGQIGSDIGVVSLNTYHLIELFYDLGSGASKQTIWAKIDGTYIASSNTRNIANGVVKIDYGGNGFGEAQTTGVWYMDDLYINDTHLKFNNSSLRPHPFSPGLAR